MSQFGNKTVQLQVSGWGHKPLRTLQERRELNQRVCSQIKALLFLLPLEGSRLALLGCTDGRQDHSPPSPQFLVLIFKRSPYSTPSIALGFLHVLQICREKGDLNQLAKTSLFPQKQKSKATWFVKHSKDLYPALSSQRAAMANSIFQDTMKD